MHPLLPAAILLVLATRAPAQTGATAQPPLDLPEGVEMVQNVVYGSAESDDGEKVELLLDAAFPADAQQPLPAVVYIHGGGYFSGSKVHGYAATLTFARGGYFAVTINYRLSGTAKYPAAVHDCKAAIRFLRGNAEKLGIDPDRIGVWGHSAGAHLTSLLAVTANDGVLEGDPPTDISAAVTCAVPVSGPADFTQPTGNRGRRIMEHWLGGDPGAAERAREASTITWVNAGDPPMLIVHGERDRMVPIAHAEALRDALQEAGVDVRYVTTPDGHSITTPEAYRIIGRFFDHHLGGKAEEAMRGR